MNGAVNEHYEGQNTKTNTRFKIGVIRRRGRPKGWSEKKLKKKCKSSHKYTVI